jgi:tetratricopeptide (TPR) repeat protein
LSAGSQRSLGFSLENLGRIAEAEAAYRKSIELAPGGIGTRAYLAFILATEGRHEEALTLAHQEPDEVFRDWGLSLIHHVQGRRPESDEALRHLSEKFGHDSAYQVAELHAARGEIDAAFDWLDRAFAQKDPGLPYMRNDLHLRPLHADPRWDAFIKKMGYEA